DAYIDKAIDALAAGGEIHDAVISRARGQLIASSSGNAFDERALHRADHALGDGVSLRPDLCLQPLQARELLVLRQRVRQLGRGRAGPGAVDEAVGIVELELTRERERRLEVRIRLAGK